MVVPYLIFVVLVVLRRTGSLIGFLCRRDENHALLSESWA
jgi:hypothetical protein